MRFITKSGFPLTATLYRDGWYCPELPLVELYLNQFYRPDGSPCRGPWGTQEIQLAAQSFGGTFSFRHLHTPDPQRVS